MVKRVQHWRWEYRLRERPHVLVAADEEVQVALRLSLQANWLLTVTVDGPLAIVLASALSPSQCVIDASLPEALMLVERLKRQRDTASLPILFLARSPSEAAEASHRGAENALIIGLPITDAEFSALHDVLLAQHRKSQEIHGESSHA